MEVNLRHPKTVEWELMTRGEGETIGAFIGQTPKAKRRVRLNLFRSRFGENAPNAKCPPNAELPIWTDICPRPAFLYYRLKS